jgi:hypothetical protein
MYNEMENYSFDSYDPNAFNEYVAMGDSYDEAAGTSPSMRAPRNGFRALGGVGQVDLLLTNTITSASVIDPGGITRFDIFNYNRSGGLIGNTQFSNRIVSGLSFEEYAVGTNPGIFNTTASAAVAAQVAAAKENKIMWDNLGNLYYTGKSTGSGVITEQLVISCRQLPYRSLLNSSSVAPFLVSKMRLSVPDTVNGKLQINQDFTHVTNTFLGATKENPISPRAFFNPQQFQTNIVDIKAAYAIDAERGLKYQVTNSLSAGTAEVHTVTLFVPAFEKPASSKSFR